MARIDYSAEQVTRALLQLAANKGNVRQTAEQLIDDDFMVSESLLRSWKNDTHREQYQRLQAEHGKEEEAGHVDQLRSTIGRAAGLEEKVLDKIEGLLDPEGTGYIENRDLPATLRALTDTKAKSVDRLLSLTGRPRDPTGPTGNDLMQLLQGMADRGYLRLAVGVDVGQPAPALPVVDHEAQNTDDGAGRG